MNLSKLFMFHAIYISISHRMMILKTMMQPNRTLYRGAGISIMDGYDFYYEEETKVNVFLQEVVKNKGE